MTATDDASARGSAAKRAASQRSSKRGLRTLAPALVVVAAASPLAIASISAIPRAVSWIKHHPYFLVETVEIRGNRRLTDEQVLHVARIAAGRSWWDLSPGRVQMRLEAHPWILRAKVHRPFPTHVAIAVTERRPIALVRFERLHSVDRRGRVLSPLGDDDSRDMPVITGLERGRGRAFAPAALPRVAQLLRWCERHGCMDEISELSVDRENGITMLPMNARVAVHLGWGRWKEKMARSARILSSWQGRLDEIALIDVSFADRVIVRRRPADPAGRFLRETKRHVQGSTGGRKTSGTARWSGSWEANRS